MPQDIPASPTHFAVFDGDLSPEWFAHYKNAKALAVDTEAMGLIHGRDRLCLVQICDDQDRVCCIRIARGQSDAPLLKELMEATGIEKVFHYARFDVAAMASGLGIAVNPIFCTKVASRLARTYSPRHGLAAVVSELVGVDLDEECEGQTETLQCPDLVREEAALAETIDAEVSDFDEVLIKWGFKEDPRIPEECGPASQCVRSRRWRFSDSLRTGAGWTR